MVCYKDSFTFFLACITYQSRASRHLLCLLQSFRDTAQGAQVTTKKRGVEGIKERGKGLMRTGITAPDTDAPEEKF
jgi:hypothetical protein